MDFPDPKVPGHDEKRQLGAWGLALVVGLLCLAVCAGACLVGADFLF